jgi:bifunctional non-homologous end joining protein LigD
MKARSELLTLADIEPMRAPERWYPPFTSDELLYEIKWDGYRLLGTCGSDAPVELRTKGGTRATSWYPEVVRTLSQVRGGPYLLDGEVVCLDDLGRSDFDRLRERSNARKWVPGLPVVWMVFDLLAVAGRSVMDLPLEARKAQLWDALGQLNKQGGTAVLVQGDLPAEASLFHQVVLGLELEGFMAKRRQSRYQPGRSDD